MQSIERGRLAARARRGLTLIEVTMASVVVTILVLGAAAAFSETVGGARASRKLTSGVLFLETVVENLGATTPANLALLDGTQSFDGADAATSEYRVDITVFESEVDLLQVELGLVDLSTGRTLGSVVTHRSMR